MLNSIKAMKRNCKATLNVFFKKNKFDDDKRFHLQNEYFCLTCKNC